MSQQLYSNDLKLDAKCFEFRLLSLHPGQWCDPLVGHLFKTQPGTTSYVGLSYTWGCRDETHFVLVNGIKIGITRNLERALRTFRKEDECLNIWVDAICINQVDLVEKGQEVGMMYTIFSQASVVRAHLGDSLDAEDVSRDTNFDGLGSCPHVMLNNDETDAVIARQHFPILLEKEEPSLSPAAQHDLVVATFCYLWCRAGESDARVECRKLSTVEGASEREPGVFQMLTTERKILASPWWNRVWIVQEAGVANSLTLTYGKVTAPFSLFASAARSGLMGSTRTTWKKVFQLFELRWLTNKPKVSTIRPPKSLLELSDKDFENNIGTPTHVLGTSLGDRIMWLLRTFREREATETRDKIFALGQLASHESRMAHYDYKQDLKILFEETTRQLVKSTAMFWLTTSDLEPRSIQGLPSWVPDWSCPGYATNTSPMWRWFISPLYNVGRIRFGDETGNQSLTDRFLSALKSDGRSQPRHQVPWEGPHEPSTLAVSSRFYHNRVSWVSDVIKPRARGKIADCTFQLLQYHFQNRDVSGFARYNTQELLGAVMRSLCFGVWWSVPEKFDWNEEYNLYPLSSFNLALLKGWLAWQLLRRHKQDPDYLTQKELYPFSLLLPYASDGSDQGTEKGSKDDDRKETALDRSRELQIDTICRRSCLFSTSDGRIGLGPGRTRVGDHLGAIDGSFCPYVVRPKAKDVASLRGDGSDATPRYELVGDCYIAGLMDSDAWGEETTRILLV